MPLSLVLFGRRFASLTSINTLKRMFCSVTPTTAVLPESQPSPESSEFSSNAFLTLLASHPGGHVAMKVGATPWEE